MTNLNFLSKSGSQSRSHSRVTLCTTVGSPSAHRRPTMLRLLSVLVLVLTVGVRSAWGADPSESITLSSGTFDTDHITWAGTSCTIQQIKASSSTAVNSSYVSAPRVYKGHILSFVAKSGYKIKSISMTVATTYYGVLTAGTAVSSNTVTDNSTIVSRTWTTTSGGTHTISSASDAGLDAIYIQNVSNSSNLQLRFSAISITYISSTPATPYTVTFYTTDGSTTSSTETSAGAGVTPPTMKATCGDWTFQGWSKSQSNSTTSTSALSTETLTNGKYYPTAATTLYPVYTRTVTGNPVETKTQTFQYDSWAKGGSSTNKSSNSYRLFHNGGYVESASALDFSTLSKVVVYGGTFGGPEYNSISIRKADETVWKDATVSGSSQTGVNNITGGTSLTGSAKLRVYSTCGTSTGSGVRISKVEIYTLETSSTTYYYSYPNCCTPLGSINGSFS